MKKYIILLIILTPFLGISQSPGENWIKKVSYNVPTADGNYTNEDGPVAVTAANRKTEVVYFDGLGRPIQKIAGQQSGTGKDLITNIEYDAYGRQVYDYLPYPSSQTDQSYMDATTFKTGQASFYSTTYGDNNPYSQKELEISPMARVLKQASPGNSWAMGQGHENKFDYRSNVANEVRMITATSTLSTPNELFTFVVNSSNYYPAGTLFKEISYDENTAASPTETSGSVVEFKDKSNKVVLKRTYESSVPYDTYYVYDQYGNLSCIVPPLAAAKTLTQAELDGMCYQYRYDYRNRVVEKKLPGKQWEFTVYDKLNRAVFQGPALNPFGSGEWGWIMTRYDGYNREVYTGWYNGTPATSAGRKQLQSDRNLATTLSESRNSGTTIGNVNFSYTNTVTPTTGFIMLTVHYYDDYSFPNAPASIPSAVLSNLGQQVFYNNSDRKPRGLTTGSWTRVLTSATEFSGNSSYTLYDVHEKQVRQYTANYMGGYTQMDSKLDFTGKPTFTETKNKRVAADTELILKEEFNYDAQDRLLTQTHQIGNFPKNLLTKNSYDQLGHIINKKIGGIDLTGSAALQYVDYSYNIQGWRTGINNTANLQQGTDPRDLFSMSINYNDNNSIGTYSGQPSYNGNISGIRWRTSSDNILRMYGYKYDNLDRLKTGVYIKPDNSTPVTNSYNEALTYDKNGNILTLKRTGLYDDPSRAWDIDNLTYYYDAVNSNQLLKVTDSLNQPSGFADDSDGTNDTSNDYIYDANGNMTSDENKGIGSISYNHLNLPVSVVINQTLANTTRTVTFVYDALGNKMMKSYSVGRNRMLTYYINGFQYKGTALDFFPTSEGYVKVTSVGGADKYNYIYNYTDQVGNIRLSYGQDPADNVLKILQENNFYPFGLRHENYNWTQKDYIAGSQSTVIVGTPMFEEGYSGFNYKFQGQERQDELGWDSFKYRNYDPAIGRFFNIDPVAEKYSYNGVYNFSENRVIDGREIEGLEFKAIKDYYSGMWQEAKSTYKAVGNMIAHPIDTYKKMVSTPAAPRKGFSSNDPFSPWGFIGKMVIPALKGDAKGVGRVAGRELANKSIELATIGVGELGGKAIGSLAKAATPALEVSNPIPTTLARAVPTEFASGLLGKADATEVFVTAAKDIQGLSATEIAEKLTINTSPSGFTVYEFPTPAEGISSPFINEAEGFIGNGRTLGGAREFIIPNQPVPANATTKIISP